MFSITEKELYAELERIMAEHRFRCSSMEIIKVPNSVYLYRIKKALSKSVVDEKRESVLRNLISMVKTEISNGKMFKEIFEPLPTIAADKLRNYRKNKDLEEKKNDEFDKQDEHRQYMKKRINYLNYILSEICDTYRPLTRAELKDLETKFNKEISQVTSLYGIENANKEIMGNLYTGLIECTRKNFVKLLAEQYGIVIKKNDKLSDNMSKELLLYKVAVLHYTNVMCNKRADKIRPDLREQPNKEVYEGLKHDVYLLGKVARVDYLGEKGITPREELIDNYTCGQITMDEIIKPKKHN